MPEIIPAGQRFRNSAGAEMRRDTAIFRQAPKLGRRQSLYIGMRPSPKLALFPLVEPRRGGFMTNYKFIVVIAISLILVGCNMAGDVKDTKDTSKNIEGYSKELDDNSKKLKDDSHYIADGTGKIFGGGRKDLTFERPDERYKELIAATGDIEKLRYATAMVRSFEFQLWTGTGDDTVKKKNEFYAKAIRDFFAMTGSLIGFDHNVDTTMATTLLGDLIPGCPSGRWKSLASIAVAMSEIDPDQQAASDANHIPAESIYTLILKGLAYKADANANKEIPEYATQVLAWEDEAYYFLQLRHNYFPAMVLSRFNDFSKSCGSQAETFGKAFAGGLLGGLFGGTPQLLSVNVNLPSNVAKIQEQGITWLEAAQETQRQLEQLGRPLEFNRGIKTIFSAVNFIAPPDEDTSVDLQAKIGTLNRRASELNDTYKTGKAH